MNAFKIFSGHFKLISQTIGIIGNRNFFTFKFSQTLGIVLSEKFFDVDFIFIDANWRIKIEWQTIQLGIKIVRSWFIHGKFRFFGRIRRTSVVFGFSSILAN